MKIGFRVIFYIICLNLATGLIYALAVPGTTYSYSLPGTGNATDYEERFNPEAMMNATKADPLLNLPYVGHILVFGLQAWNIIRFVVAGFPMMLEQYAGYIVDETGRTAFLSICYVLEAIFAFVIVMWLVQVFTGRTFD